LPSLQTPAMSIVQHKIRRRKLLAATGLQRSRLRWESPKPAPPDAPSTGSAVASKADSRADIATGRSWADSVAKVRNR
jgi:hypothetical protein